MYSNASAVLMRRRGYRQIMNREYVTIDKNLTFLDLPLNCLNEHRLAVLLETFIQVGKERLGDTG